MAKAKSWSVKGIDGATRDLARDAAQAAGLPIGSWIDQAILRVRDGELQLPPTAADAALDKAPKPPPDMPAEETPAEARVNEPPATATPIPSNDSLPADSGQDSDGVPDGVSDPVPSPQAPPRRPIVADPETRVDRPTPANADTPLTADEGRDVDDGSMRFDPRPLETPTARPSILRYGIAAGVLLAILAGGIWVFVELSTVERPPLPQTVASKDKSAPPVTPRSPSTPASPSAAPATALPDEIRTGIELAKAGDAKAQHDLGMLYLTGRHVQKNTTEAAAWFEKAAVQGLENAQFNLGVLYQRGEGVAQNDRLAFFWYQSAAEQGFARAQHNLATAYAEGRGTEVNYPKAVEWLTKAANAGLGASQFSLASLYELGFATGKPDLVQARKWYEQAAARGDTQAPERLALIEKRLAAVSSAAPVPPPPEPEPASSRPIGRTEIKEIQTLLDAMNFKPGPVDGSIGRRTIDAIKLFQGFAGMEADGKASRELLEELRAVAATMAGKT